MCDQMLGIAQLVFRPSNETAWEAVPQSARSQPLETNSVKLISSSSSASLDDIGHVA